MACRFSRKLLHETEGSCKDLASDLFQCRGLDQARHWVVSPVGSVNVTFSSPNPTPSASARFFPRPARCDAPRGRLDGPSAVGLRCAGASGSAGGMPRLCLTGSEMSTSQPVRFPKKFCWFGVETLSPGGLGEKKRCCLQTANSHSLPGLIVLPFSKLLERRYGLAFCRGNPKMVVVFVFPLKTQKKDTLKKDEPPMFLDMVNDPPKRTPGRPGFREHDLAQGCQQESLVPVLRHGRGLRRARSSAGFRRVP